MQGGVGLIFLMSPSCCGGGNKGFEKMDEKEVCLLILNNLN
jgi:hypothetical protein